MAVRSPLYYNSGNLQEMSSAMVDQIVDQTVYQYSLNPSVSLSVVSSNGSLDAISDTRLQAGAASTSTTAFPNEATTAEPSVVTVSYDKLSSSTTGSLTFNDNGSNISEIVENSGMSRSTVYKTLKKLSEEDIIYLTQSQDDGRESLITLKSTS